MYNALFDSIINNNLRADFRNPRFLALIKSYLKPLYELSVIFTEYKEKTLDVVSHNGQIIYLEHRLNQLYNNGDPGIVIADTANVEYVYLSNKSEGYDPVYIFNKGEAYDPVFIGNKAEYGAAFDFIVQVPAPLYADLLLNDEQGLNNMKSVINMYKLAGKRYKIESL